LALPAWPEGATDHFTDIFTDITTDRP